MRNQITNYLRAGYPGLYLVSAEEARIEAEMKLVAQTLGHKLYAWSITEGLVDTSDGHPREAHDPVQLLEAVAEFPENTIVLLKDFHLFTEDANSVIIRQVRECLRVGKTKGKALVVVGCRLALPPELERELVVIPFALPDKEQLGVVLDAIARSSEKSRTGGSSKKGGHYGRPEVQPCCIALH